MKKTLLEVGALIVHANEIIDQPAYLIMADGKVEEYGVGTYQGQRTGFSVVSRPKSLAMPGLVNAHGHAAMTLLRGVGDDLPLQKWLSEKVLPLEAKLTEDAIYWGTQLACWEMLRSGTTCFTDMYFMMHNAAQAVSESGIRAVLSWGMVGFDQTQRENGIRNSREFVSRWNGHDGRITVTLGPHAPYTCPPEYLEQIAGLSEELDVPIQIHLSETKVEVEKNFDDFRSSPIRHAEACGLFHRPVLAAHCVHVSDDDIELLRKYDVRVAHNPQSNLKLASGVAPVVKMRNAGITVGLGTDGAASNNNLDMFEELRLAATLHKGVLMDPTVIPAAEAFQMATEDSARCVFLPSGHGTLGVGCSADVVLLDMASPHFLPTYSYLSNVVYAAGADDVTDVFVAGRQLLSQREPTTVDVERLQHEVRKIETLLKSV